MQAGTWVCGKCATVNRPNVERCTRCNRKPGYSVLDIGQMTLFTKVLLTLGVLAFLLIIFLVLYASVQSAA